MSSKKRINYSDINKRKKTNTASFSDSKTSPPELKITEDLLKTSETKDTMEVCADFNNLYEEYKVDAQVKALSKIPSFFSRMIVFTITGIILGTLNFFMIKFYGFDDYQKYLYPISSLITCIFILIMLKFNYKVIILGISFFSAIKYFYYYLDELSEIYSQSVMFDLYIFSLTFIFILFIFTLKHLVYAIYMICSILINLFFSLYVYTKITVKKGHYWVVPVLLIIDIVVFNYFYINDLNFNVFGIYNVIIVTLMIIFNIFFAVFGIAGYYYQENKNIDESLRKASEDLIKPMGLTYKIFNFSESTNKYIGEIHENLSFMRSFDFYELNKTMSYFYIGTIVMCIYNITSFYNYYGTYQYDKSFFENNNGYCSNINKDDLIFKSNNHSDSVFVITYKENENSYIYRKGDVIDWNDRKIGLAPYYIYEKKCLKIL